jgi:hypothetical protein
LERNCGSPLLPRSSRDTLSDFAECGPLARNQQPTRFQCREDIFGTMDGPGFYISLFPPSCIRTLTRPTPRFQAGIIAPLFALWRSWRCGRCRHVFGDRRRIVSGRLISSRKSRNVATFHRINQIALRSATDGFAHWFLYRWRRLRECRRRQQEHDNSQFVHFIP